MKLEVGRIYVLIDEELSFLECDAKHRRLVRLIGMHENILCYDKEGNIYCDVEGFSFSNTTRIVVPQLVRISALKPASEKQRAMFIKKEKEIFL